MFVILVCGSEGYKYFLTPNNKLHVEPTEQCAQTYIDYLWECLKAGKDGTQLSDVRSMTVVDVDKL